MKWNVQRVWTTACVVALSWGAQLGCMSGMTSSKLDSAQDQRRRPTSKRATTGIGDHGSSDASRLAIYGETVKADEIWYGRYDELDEQAKTRTPSGFREFVARRAGQLIRDRIAEVLLSRQASLRVPPEVEGRLDSYVDAEIRKIVTTDHDGRQRRFERFLESRGQSLEDVRARLRREVLVSSYLEQEIRPKIIEPTRAELHAEFLKTLDSYRRPSRRRMSLIEARITDRLPQDVNRPTREQVDAARHAALERIRSAYAEHEGGGDFAEIARRYSDGLHAPEGGAWDWITQGSVRERFEPAVDTLFTLDENAVSEIVEGKDSFFLVQCQEIDNPVTPTFESLQPQLRSRVVNEQYNRWVMEHVEKLTQEAQIDPAALDRFYGAVVEAALLRQTETAP